MISNPAARQAVANRIVAIERFAYSLPAPHVQVEGARRDAIWIATLSGRLTLRVSLLDVDLVEVGRVEIEETYSDEPGSDPNNPHVTYYRHLLRVVAGGGLQNYTLFDSAPHHTQLATHPHHVHSYAAGAKGEAKPAEGTLAFIYKRMADQLRTLLPVAGS